LELGINDCRKIGCCTIVIILLSATVFSQTDNIGVLKGQIKNNLLSVYPHISKAEVTVTLLTKKRLMPYARSSDYQLVLMKNKQKKAFSSPRIPKRWVVPIRIYHNEKSIKHVNIPVQFSVLKRVAVSKRLIKRNESLSQQNVQFVTRDITALPTGVFTEGQSLIDYEAVYAISPGRVLTGASVRKTPLIRRGDRILLQSRVGRIIVEAEGVARSDGCPDELIRVQNIRSKRYLEGRVLDRYTVSIDP